MHGSTTKEPLILSVTTDTSDTVRSNHIPLFRTVETPVWLFFLQVFFAIVYTVFAFVLPSRVSYMSEATHIASIHGILSVILALLAIPINQKLDNDPEILNSSSYYPLSHTIADAPIYVVWIANALLLIFLGVESWLQTEIGNHFSVLGMVQLLSGVEIGAILLPFAHAIYRWIQYRKLLEVGDTLVRSHETRTIMNTNNNNNNGGIIVNNNDIMAGKPRLSYASPFPIQRTYSRTDNLLLVSPGIMNNPSSTTNNNNVPALAQKGLSRGASFLHDVDTAINNSNVNTTGLTSSTGSFISPQQLARLSDRIRTLEKKEEHLLKEMRTMAIEFAKVSYPPPNPSSSEGSEASSSVVSLPDLAVLLRNAMDDIGKINEENKRLLTKITEYEEKSTYLENELRRAAADVQKLRGALKEEKKKNDKLYSTLDLEREANAQAQNAINELRGRLNTSTTASLLSSSSLPSQPIDIVRGTPSGSRSSFSALNNPSGGLSRSPGNSSYFGGVGQTPVRSYSSRGGMTINMPAIVDE